MRCHQSVLYRPISPCRSGQLSGPEESVCSSKSLSLRRLSYVHYRIKSVFLLKGTKNVKFKKGNPIPSVGDPIPKVESYIQCIISKIVPCFFWMTPQPVALTYGADNRFLTSDCVVSRGCGSFCNSKDNASCGKLPLKNLDPHSLWFSNCRQGHTFGSEMVTLLRAVLFFITQCPTSLFASLTAEGVTLAQCSSMQNTIPRLFIYSSCQFLMSFLFMYKTQIKPIDKSAFDVTS